MRASLLILVLFLGLVAGACRPKQEEVNGVCKKKCKAGFTRNDAGDCRKNCSDNATDNGDGKCKCNEGFEKYGKTCVPPCGNNMRRKAGKCICKNGFKLEGDVCVSKACPENEELKGSKCFCVKGTRRINGKCVGDCAENMKRISGICQCKKNFEMFDNECVEKCGRNSERDDTGVCVCLIGFEDTTGDGNCKKIKCSGKNVILDGNDCVCDEGFVEEDGACVEPSGPEPPEPEPAPPGCWYEAKGHKGHDISWGFGSNEVDCVEKCEENEGCMGSTFDKSNLCWLHHTIEKDLYYDACDGCSLYVKDCDDAANPVPDFSDICPANANCDSGDVVCNDGYQLVNGACEQGGDTGGEHRGPPSGTGNDAPSKVTCPEGQVIYSCKCSIHPCDQVALADNGRSCIAYNAEAGKRVQSIADCRAPYIAIRSEGRGANPRVDCPEGYEPGLCRYQTFWGNYPQNKGAHVVRDCSGCQVEKCGLNCTAHVLCFLTNPDSN